MEVAPIKSSHLPPVSDGFMYNEVEDECGHNACHYALALLIQVAGGKVVILGKVCNDPQRTRLL